jgi:hypothetical protein
MGEGRLVGILPGGDPDTCPIAALKAWLRVAEGWRDHTNLGGCAAAR